MSGEANTPVQLGETPLNLDRSITGAQCVAARALLHLEQRDLAEAAGISRSTLQAFEASQRTPHRRTVDRLRATLEKRGVQFLFDGPGVQLRASGPISV